jgi:hypothetical protein
MFKTSFAWLAINSYGLEGLVSSTMFEFYVSMWPVLGDIYLSEW